MNKKKQPKSVQFLESIWFYFSPCIARDKVPEKGGYPLGMEYIPYAGCSFNFQTRKQTYFWYPEEKDSKPKFGIYSKEDETIDDLLMEMDYLAISTDDRLIDYTPKSALEPLTPKERKKYLKEFGGDPEFANEKRILTETRLFREDVGCSCKSGKCNYKCLCSLANVPCQGGSSNWPCKCGDKCNNKQGKHRFNSYRVKYHYHHTMNTCNDSNSEPNYKINPKGDCEICAKMSNSELEKMYAPKEELSNKKTRKNTTKIQLKEIKPKKIKSKKIEPTETLTQFPTFPSHSFGKAAILKTIPSFPSIGSSSMLTRSATNANSQFMFLDNMNHQTLLHSNPMNVELSHEISDNQAASLANTSWYNLPSNLVTSTDSLKSTMFDKVSELSNDNSKQALNEASTSTSYNLRARIAKEATPHMDTNKNKGNKSLNKGKK